MRYCVTLAAASMTLCSPAAAQSDSAAARTLVGDVADRITAAYVVDEKRSQLVDALRAGATAGRYNALTGDALARRLTDDMAAIAHDKHLGVRYAPDEARLLGTEPQRDDDDGSPAFRRFMAAHAYGVRELRLLDGNVRYMAYDGFMYDGAASDTAIETAMRFLAGGDAVVLDLRSNGGGDPRAVATLTSYFLPAKTPLARFEMRGKPAEANATHSVPLSLTGKPLYVLTSNRTASAAEEFATHISAFGLGTLLGATTAGAAYRNEMYALTGGYVLSVSVGRPVHAKTGGSWEGTGVKPNLVIDPGMALEAAQGIAYDNLAGSATPDERRQLQRLGAFYAARTTPVTLSRAAAVYAGRFGERTVRSNAGSLAIQRDGGPESALVPLGADRFALAQDPTTQVKFTLVDGKARTLELSRASGEVVRATRQ